MKKTSSPAHLRLIPLTVALGLITCGLAAHAAPAAAPPPAPPGGFQGDLDLYLADAEEKILALEEAVPQSKLTWRPAPGVRSFAEVYLHIAFANYNLTRLVTGTAPPADAGFVTDRKKWDTKTTDKAEIKKILARSFAHMRASVKKVSDADLERKIDFFGKRVSARAGLLQLLAHAYEHLGQSIAYARSNDVTPPWSKNEK